MNYTHAIRFFFIPFTVFAIFLILGLFISARLGVYLAADSGSYFYLLESSITSKIPNIMRPLSYPLFLLLGSRFFPDKPFHAVVLVQVVMYAYSALFVYLLASRFMSSRFCIFLCMIFLLFNFNTIPYVSFLIPETLSLFLLTAFIFWFGMTFDRLRDADIIFLVFFMTFLAFTKPSFVYFPVVVVLYFFLLALFRIVSLRHLLLLVCCSILFILLPVWGWSYGNKVNSNYYTFSNIQEINLSEKLFLYNLEEEGPDVVNGIPVKSILMKLYDPRYGIYGVLEFIEQNYSSNDYYNFAYALFDFSRQTYSRNFFTYTVKSLQLMPNIFFRLKEGDGISYLLDNSTVILDENHPLKVWMDKYIRAYILLFIYLLKPVVIIFVVLSIVYLIRDIERIFRKKITKDRIFYIFVFLTILYYTVAVSFGAYDQFDRMFSPVNFLIIFMLFMVISRTIQTGKRIHMKMKR